MKPLLTIIAILLLGASKLFADPVMNADSLKKQLTATSDSLKAPLYTRMAAGYLSYDTVADSDTKREWQNNALNYTLQALHYYSRYNDTTGLRISFNTLARVYRSQKKYSQAKWFILQSNTLSRDKHDVPNIITSLIELAYIKSDIKDYKLALGDLKEAQKLSTDNHLARKESVVQVSYSSLYTLMKDKPKAIIAYKRHKFIDDSLRKQDEAAMIAKISVWDSLQSKKKLYVTKSPKPLKTATTASIVSL